MTNKSQQHQGAGVPPQLSLLSQGLTSFEGKKILVVGDIMLDEYLTGDAERISPEAPVPVVHVHNELRLLGGGGNVARNIAALDGKACLVGIRGKDIAGEVLEESLASEGIISALAPSALRPTTIKTRILARGQQVLRVDKESVVPFSHEERDIVLQAVKEHMADSDAVIVSDYGKGLISPEFMEELVKSLRDTARNIPLLVDPKPQNMRAYKGVTVLTPNNKEAGLSLNRLLQHPRDVVEAGRQLIAELECAHLVITLGADGMAIFDGERSVWHLPTVARKVFDVTGAGDTVIATMGMGLAAGMSLRDACILANHAAGIVVAEVGAATAGRQAIHAALTAEGDFVCEDWSFL